MEDSESITANFAGRVLSRSGDGRQSVEDHGGRHIKEYEEGISDIFKLFDGDQDGQLSRFECKEALWSLGQHLCDDEVDGLFQEHDLKRKGTLDYDAFKELIFARLSYNSSRKEFEEAFRAIDHDEDGCLDVGEIRRLLAAVGYKLTQQEQEEVFGELDRDGSGRIDLEEFVDCMMAA